MDVSYEPEPKYQHCSALVQDKWYNYGGKLNSVDESTSPSAIEEFYPAHRVWKQHPTHGDTPPGYIGSAATSIGSKFYHFGGFCGEKFHNTISELDVNTFQWKKLESINEDGICPIPKMDAGMIAFDNRVLVIYGGKGITPDGEVTWTNQLHCFNTETKKWYIPTMSGERNLTPCEGCTFTKVDYYRAVLFDGHESDCLQILDMKNWIWSVVKSSSDLFWPNLRGYHLAISLCETGNKKEESPEDPQLMILFEVEDMMDSWVYNFRKERWSLGVFPEYLIKRSAACVRNSTCLLYHNPKSSSTKGRTLFLFGGGKCNPSSPMKRVNEDSVLEMDVVNDSFVLISAKRLKTDWLSVNPDYPELTHFEEERKQTFHLSPGKEQHMDLSNIGISLRFSINSEGDSEGDSEVSVLPAVGGPFAMPEGYKPKSPIYMMTEKSNKKLKKNIAVKMSHWANLESEEDCKEMTFLKGPAEPMKEGSRLIYKFEVIVGANCKFAKGDRQGEITLQEVVPLCIAYKQSTSRKKLTTAYFLKLYSTPSPCDNYCAILIVSIYQDLYEKLLSSFMKKKYPALTESTFKSPIHFDKDQIIKLEWNTEKAWAAISDIDPPIILQEEVDLPNSLSEGHGITFEDGEKYPPRIKLTFIPEEPHVPSNCKITVHGLTRELSFNLHLSTNKHPETPKSLHRDSLHEDQVKEVEPGHRETYLLEILSLLDPAAFKWESIGIALDFSTGDLHNIKHNHTLAPEGPRAFLRVLIQQWLRWTPPDHNFPTLESLYNALKSPTVDEQVLAEKLFQKIMTEKNLSTLMQRNPDIETRVNDSIQKLEITIIQWKENEMTVKIGEVVCWMKEIMNHLKEPSDLFSKAGMIKSHCEAISQLSQDVLQEAEAQSVNGAKDLNITIKDLKKCKESVITISQLLHKQAHLQLTYSQGKGMEEWVPAMESVINQMINLADALKKHLEQTDLVIRETPRSTKNNQWTIVKTLTRKGSEVGYVKKMEEKMGDLIPVSGRHPRGSTSGSTSNHNTDPGSPK